MAVIVGGIYFTSSGGGGDCVVKIGHILPMSGPLPVPTFCSLENTNLYEIIANNPPPINEKILPITKSNPNVLLIIYAEYAPKVTNFACTKLGKFITL